MAKMKEQNETYRVPPSDELVRELVHRIQAGAQLIWLNAHGDEGRILASVQAAANEISATARQQYQNQNISDTDVGKLCKYDVASWSVLGASWKDKLQDPMLVLQNIAHDGDDNCLFVMFDLANLLAGTGNLALRRLICSFCMDNVFNNTARARPLIIVSRAVDLPAVLKDYADTVEFALPGSKELLEVVSYIHESTVQTLKATGQDHKLSCCELTNDQRRLIVESLAGLSYCESIRALSLSVRTSRGFNNDQILDAIAKEKANSIKKIPGLSFIDKSKIRDLSAVGGFNRFIPYLQLQAGSYSEAAKLARLEKPRGTLLLGPAGTGKTMIAEIAASILKKPLLTVDVGAIFNKHVGESEQLARMIFATLSALKSCVVLFNELDKSLAYSHQAAGDSGVSSRILGYFLEFLERRDVSPDSEEQIFVVATINRIEGLPTELTRTGRFDRIFYTYLPTVAERLQILKIHLGRRGIDPQLFGESALQDVADLMDMYTGSDIEELVISSRKLAFANRQTGIPTIDDLLAAKESMSKPAAARNADELERLKEFCLNYAVPVHLEERESRRNAKRRVVA